MARMPCVRAIFTYPGALGLFAFARFARLQGLVRGVEKREAYNALRRAADDFHRDAAAHRMPGYGKLLRRALERHARHLLIESLAP